MGERPQVIDGLPVCEFGFPGALRDELVAAVLLGEKTATASLRSEYLPDGEDTFPEVGMRSIVGEVGEGFPRLRVGVGPEDATREVGMDLADFVLSPFDANEREAVERALTRASEACEVAVRDGVKRAMDLFNGG